MNNSLSADLAAPTDPRRVHWAALSLALVAGIASLILVSCKRSGADAKPADVDYYTCTMHPSVKKQSPTDKCPICSMDLVPVKKKADNASAADAGHSGRAGHMAGATPETGASTNED